VQLNGGTFAEKCGRSGNAESREFQQLSVGERESESQMSCCHLPQSILVYPRYLHLKLA